MKGGAASSALSVFARRASLLQQESYMPLDRSKLHKGFQTYLANAETASGKSYEDFALVLSKSGLKKHGELRMHLMEKLGLGHGHANAVVAIWMLPGNGGAVGKKSAPKKAPAKKK
jgi:hypothetical protein